MFDNQIGPEVIEDRSPDEEEEDLGDEDDEDYELHGNSDYDDDDDEEEEEEEEDGRSNNHGEDSNFGNSNTHDLETSCQVILDNWENWFMSPDGGNKKQKDARHHARQVGKVLQDIGSLSNLFNKTILWQSWLQPFEKRKDSKGKTTAVGTIKSYLSSLHLFYSYLINENIEVPATQEEVLRTKETVKTWSRNYRKKCNRQHWEKEHEDFDKLVIPEEMRQFDSSKPVREAIKMFSRLSTSSFRMDEWDFTNLRDYLLFHLCMQNATRTGAICNMKIHEAKKSKRIGNTMSIVVLDHKTLTEGAGPATLNLDPQVYKQLEIFIESVRPTVQSPSDHQMFVFVTGDEGKKLNTSQVSEQFNSFWKRAVGATERRPRMNATIFRYIVYH